MSILIINGHPDPKSYNKALADAYRKGAESSGATVNQLDLFNLNFDPVLHFGYRKRTELEPDLLNALELIRQARHIVWVYPMWWYGMPALLKGFIDRVFLPGIAFEYSTSSPFPKKLLKGRSARIIMTADSPLWYNRLVMRNPALNQFKKGILEFCGIRPVSISYIAVIRSSSSQFRNKWLQKAEALGRAQK